MLPPGNKDRLSMSTLPGSASCTASSPLKSVVLGVMSAENFFQESLMPSKMVSAYTSLES